MKRAVIGLTVMMIVPWICAVSRANDPFGDPGKLLRIDIKATHPKAYRPAIGDLVQCYLDYPIVPGQMVTNLKVTASGKSIALLGVVKTTRPDIVGAEQMSVFLLPRQPGLAKLTVEPLIPAGESGPTDINFWVQLAPVPE